MRLKDKIAVVTGGGRGIGRGIALGFAREGADVIVAARTQSEIDSTAEAIRGLGRRALAVRCDTTDPAQVEDLAHRVRAELGRMDILVNNSGGGDAKGRVVNSDPVKWMQVLHNNLTSTYIVSRAFVPLLVESGGGRIINVGSGAGHTAMPGNTAYSAAKAGLWMFTRCFAMEVWKEGILVNELVPGPVETTGSQGRHKMGVTPPFAESEIVKTPDDVAPLVIWLAEQGPGGPTGQSFSLARRPL